jgi:glucosyl-3-phosphoglycerate synthase
MAPPLRHGVRLPHAPLTVYESALMEIGMTTALRWARARSYHHSSFTAPRLRAQRTQSISVCVPARETATTIGPIVETLLGLREAGAVDQVVVVDAASQDGTAEVARAAGAEVHQESELMADWGPVLGKGDAMWRSLSALWGDVVCYVDGDTEIFGEHFACAIAGPVACEPGVQFVKGFFRRPFKVGDLALPEGGGRVTELTARPLLRLFYTELAEVRQPLAGEVAARRELLERLPFATGYAVETAMLIDAYREVGLDGLAQVDLEQRQNRHQPLSALGPMADEVLGAVSVRLEREGRLAAGTAPVRIIERPPMATLRS